MYELFQSGYAGLPYDPDAVVTERVDERIYKINEVGQYELFYDPDEEVEQGKDTSDLPTQLEAVIDSIASLFDGDAGLMLPDKPWLPGLAEAIPSPEPRGAGAGVDAGYAVPLGMLDIPSRQAQENYDFDLVKAGHTVVFGSPGYGKSTVLQTLVVNLAKACTPEQLHVNLIDFGNNGLLPLRDLPNVADIVTLEEGEKLGKMLEAIAVVLATRKQLFKAAGVANLEQYTTKTKQQLPVLVNVVDGYDNLTANDRRKDKIDDLLLQVLREGAGLGVYVVMSASRVGGVRVNMLSNISTKLCLFLNDEGELAQLMGRERLLQVDAPGRGQVLTDVPTAIQFYLPGAGGNSSEVLAALEEQVSVLDAAWVGVRPEKIPMVPEALTPDVFAGFGSVREVEAGGGVPLGLSKATTTARGFLPRTQPFFLFAAKDDEQEVLFQQRLLTQGGRAGTEFLIVDFDESFEEVLEGTSLPSNFSRVTSKGDAGQVVAGIVAYLGLNKQKVQGTPMVLVIANLADFVVKTGLKPDDFVLALKNTFKVGLDFMIFSRHDYVSKSFDPVPKLLRDLKFSGLVGARAYDSALVKSMGTSTEPEPGVDEPFFVMRGGSMFEKIKLPRVKGAA
ncbi:FtsK/SpoIIIE domain-containing protein [Leucobacter insecticola]|uniref:FtsK/SpoIIIE domain-containing protein n=1 Tax=Leucobacter insecticola TaxID=2714934 RepID=UPI00197EA4A2|nr:FtsK/SpoIIIE domain-containing protein [Leucobacter insecticola]